MQEGVKDFLGRPNAWRGIAPAKPFSRTYVALLRLILLRNKSAMCEAGTPHPHNE